MKKKVVVIGGGLAGSLICNELVKSSDVFLLEIGEKNTIRYPQVNFINKKFAEVNTFCFGGGGTTNLWHNGLIPINKEDITCKEFSEVLAEAQGYIDQAASALYFNNKSFSLEYTNLLSGMNLIAKKMSVFEDGIDCLIYPKKFKKLSVDFRVNDFYSVNNIDFVAEDRRIKTVNYSIGNEKYSIDADIVIVSAGTLGSPKILNKIISTMGLCFNNLGTGFIDHPMGFVGKVKFKKEFANLIKKLALYQKAEYVCRNAVRIKSECRHYTCCVFFRPALTMDNRLSIYKYKSSIGASQGLARLKNMFSLKILHPDIIAEIFSHIFGFNIPSRTYNILLIAEQKRGTNRIYYDGDDLKADWSITEEEISIYRDILQKLKTMLSGISDELDIETGITEDWLWSAAHHSGTTPLGHSDDDIIEKDLKLKFCDNVFVCDGSVIQEHSYANTGLTIGSLAMRLAERVCR